MAASDPTMAVATPTGVLQGVAAFSWDSTAWQPVGRAGPAVATPTGALQGVAPFAWDGSVWQPSGRAGPGVATPTGVLDGVAVYTWSGSAWTPAGGTATPSTPSGALRGVAAFSWDGSAWQPAAQAGPSVATPYGVLQGVAMFNWSGIAWSPGSALPAGATLDLSFLTPGTLDPRITFTRASTGTYFDSTGTMRTATTNAPRWDYNPSTHALNGLLIEEARTNQWLFSSDLSNAATGLGGTGGTVGPGVTGNATVAPDGTTTGTRVVYPAVTLAGQSSCLQQALVVSAVAYTFSVWLCGAVGGEVVYLCMTPDGATYVRQQVILTTAWQRFSVTGTLTATTWFFLIGTDRRDAAQSATPAQTIFAWGAQVELGAFPTSYIPTTAASVTRAQDGCIIPPASMGFFTSPGGSWLAEFNYFNTAPANNRVIGQADSFNSSTSIFIQASKVLGQYDSVAAANGTTVVNPNTIVKAASTWAVGSAKLCANGGAVDTGATLTNGYTAYPAFGVGIMGIAAGGLTTSGYIRRVRYWPRALTNAELQQVTT